MKQHARFLWTVAILAIFQPLLAQEYGKPPEGARTIKVRMVALEQPFVHNRLGAMLPQGQMYALEHDVVRNDCPYDEFGHDDIESAQYSADLESGNVRLKSYKRPRPIVLRANKGDILEIHFRNLLPKNLSESLRMATVEVFGLQWLSRENNKQLQPGESHVYRFFANEEGVFMLMSPNGESIGAPNKTSHNDYGLFGAVNVQPETAEYYRSQVTHEDLQAATLRFNKKTRETRLKKALTQIDTEFLDGSDFGLPEGIDIREKLDSSKVIDNHKIQLRFPSENEGTEPKIADVSLRENGYLYALTGQPLIDYGATYGDKHPRSGFPVLDMLRKLDGEKNVYELVHSDLTALITGPKAGRFPYYVESPSFTANPATPDRRQPYREFTIMYHIAPNTQEAFEPFGSDTDPLYYTLQAGADGFAINYGIAGIGPEIYANRINRGPQGFHKDGVDLKFEEFFLSAWAVGDPAMIVDVFANTPITDPENPPRATKALYPDDPSNVYHSYMRDHLKFRVLNTGSVAPHVHHQHAHQWLHTPNSDDGHYLDSQMINPGSTYTMEMTYNGSGNRNQTVGDSIFHCHFYPHFAQGMWSMWRVHDVFEQGTELDKHGKPRAKSRALPDGEIALGTPIPALVPLPTIGMAPMPAEVYLVDGGRRSEVVPSSRDSDGKPVYDNPGFPFFIPGVAGHRAPHPPMDFGWKETKDGEPRLITEANEDAFHKKDEIDYLDGGLPRHLILGGEIVREFHSRWDFTKDFIARDEHEKFLKGGLTAIEIPDEGTPVEKAAMLAHATRSHTTHQPNGLPGNFILNGLPPAPGAPFASPDVDDDGNSNYEARRYKAAVVQTDVVFNKEGWHYPQQRFITLLEDVKATISGERAPEPFFFRANTGETIEFWHTNLVPAYYELDDFQVRTPTDIIGQHIHLVKFDVTSSDGAANGFNYEDGTFSPDEVRDRIDAINAYGGLYHFNEALKAEGKQSPLKIASYKEDYGDILGSPPAGQDWNGAQTTVQRFDTDALLNNQGEDRTLRTVFTHDHFGPSTHQQVGLYGALLVEPAGSKWIDALTGKQFPSKENPRSDGGPTSWQAIIETHDSEQSYREFAIAVADLQLSYRPQSKSERTVPKAVWFSISNEDYTKDLDAKQVPAGVKAAFAKNGAILTDAVIESKKDSSWILVNNEIDRFKLSLNGKLIDVRTLSMEKGWADPEYASWPPTNSTPAPNPTIISDPGGSGNIGGWVANYRNEPLDARVQGTDVSPATDPSWSFASIKRSNTRLNSQPEPGSRIAEDSEFRYPKTPLLPRGEGGVTEYDPYTPLLRAYGNDKVEVRAIVGAVDSVHSFRIQGNRWLAEPSSENSGFRDVQGFAISEHFEMAFRLPPADKQTSFADYLYAPSTSTQGLVKGSWGLMRSYRDKQDKLAEISSNPVGKKNAIDGFYDPPADAIIRKYKVSVALSADKTKLVYGVDGKALPTLVLRANAGDWLEITLQNNLPATLPDSFQSAPISSSNNSSALLEPYKATSTAGLHTMMLSYDTTKAAGMNVGLNSVKQPQTVESGKSTTYYWYAGAIELVDGERVMTPIEFGGVHLLPSDPMLQQSFGLFGVISIQPIGSQWSDAQAHDVVATIKDAGGEPLFTEIIIAGNAASAAVIGDEGDIVAEVSAGSEVRFRVLNSGNAAAGQTTNSTNMITIQGHNWLEEPYIEGSTVIGHNPESQTLGTQQVTSLESYNLVLPSAGGVHKQAGNYTFFYYPKGDALGTLKVTPAP
ncbi:MAG: hypothetical protein ACSHX0_07615 [Akkermansiaceae bacterium]